jgi:hypothetical protein
VRSLIDRIELTPVSQHGKEALSIILQGQLASMLRLATNAKGAARSDPSDPSVRCTKFVAGACNTPCPVCWCSRRG